MHAKCTIRVLDFVGNELMQVLHRRFLGAAIVSAVRQMLEKLLFLAVIIDAMKLILRS